MKTSVIVLLVLLQSVIISNAQPLQTTVDSLARNFKGEVGIYAVSPANGDTVSYNADKMFPTASVIKIYVLGKLYHDVKMGVLRMSDKVTLHNSDRVPGSGILLFMHDGLELTLGDLAWLMINMSDNVAANMLVDRVGGVEQVTDFIKQSGLTKTKMLAKIFDKNVYSDSLQRKTYAIGVSTPQEAAFYLSNHMQVRSLIRKAP
ncbi:MAG TPA: serine hydrolase [Candidatus Acidoferrales bacterium]|nr:serine hydrolase [Candidatus Acidoferrales bacterium]